MTTTHPSWTNGTVTATNVVAPTAPAPAFPTASATRWHSVDSPRLVQAVESHSRFLHISEQGVYLRRIGSRIRVTKEEAILLDVPAAKLQGIVLYGNVQVSTQCMRALLEEGVWLSFFTRNGAYKGRLQPPCERGGQLRIRQWERSRDQAYCLEFARAVVRAKILSQREMAAAYSKNYLAETLGTGYGIVRDMLARVETVAEIDQMRGIEGTASRAYFDLFRNWNRSEIPFDGREKHPPPDPMNALLSFGYTLLNRELEGILEGAGLDPTIGFYHTQHKDRPSLACDWIEEFRHEVVDRMVLNLINLGKIKQIHFEDRQEQGGIRLIPDGLRIFLHAYENALLGKYRVMFLQQLGLLLDSLSTGTPYRTHAVKPRLEES